MTTAAMLTDPTYERFRRLVHDESGMDIPPTRRNQIEQAVARSLKRGDLQDPEDLLRHLSSPAGHLELEELVASLTIGETHFFRNKPQFEALAQRILPDLIRRRSADRRLRVWSAGCSSGEEPYSLAMLLDGMLPRADGWKVTILATDIDREALKKARAGMYREWSFREVPPHVRPRYFEQHGDRLELIPNIRRMVTFDYLNLVEDAYPSILNNTTAMDLILCRNVLIYFRAATASSVIERLARSMSDGAWLVLGHAEPADWVQGRLAMRAFPRAIAYQKPEGLPAAQTPIVSPAPLADRLRVTRREPKREPAAQPQAEPTTQQRCEQAIAMRDAGDVEGALVELRSVADADQSDPRPTYLLAKIHAGKLQVEQAQKWSRVTIERDLLYAPAYHLLGLMAAEEGRLDDAIEALRRCVYAAPDWPVGHLALADVYLRLDQPLRARAALSTVTRTLQDVATDEEVWEGDGLTAGRLRELAHMQLDISGLGEMMEAHGG